MKMIACLALTVVWVGQLHGEALLPVDKVAAQPLSAQVRTLIESLDYLGAPLAAADRAGLEEALKGDDATLVKRVQEILDPLCLAGIDISPESRVKVVEGAAAPVLEEDGWRVFLVKVHNQAGVTAELKADSPNAKPLAGSPAGDLKDRWLEMQLFTAAPMKRRLSGLELEYRIIQLYSRDAGKRSAKIAFNVGQGTQDIGFRNDVQVLFEAVPSTVVTLGVKDEEGKPTTAGFIFRDAQGRVYPSQAKRLAPDFAFHPQVYRADGETIKLPAGKYNIEVSRGPEYVPGRVELAVGKEAQRAEFKLERWIDPSKMGWWSGDHHIHAAGCAHYSQPTQGVLASDMFRHCLGEDLKVGCNLTWGPCFDYQKQFFTGKEDKVSTYPYLLRYDIEVSGFGSHQSGHLCLLRLKEEIYPGGDSDKHWPTLCLNTLKWAKKQGAVSGPAHSGWGLAVPGDALPNYAIPPYDGIGADEYIVDVTHNVPGPDGKLSPAVDFMSTVDTPSVWELNMWYQTLNCGYRTRISGETDFPCIYGERVGLGRSYVKLEGKLNYDDWCEGIRAGRNYVSEGHSHLMESTVGDAAIGEGHSELKLANPGTVKVSARVAAMLPEQSDPSIKAQKLDQKPYWNIERARIANSRKVKVEAVVNGYPVASKEIVADGKLADVSFDVKIDRSSWVAMRILPSSHTNPVFVLVNDKPIRASRRSAEWCLKGVDACWAQKRRFIAAGEMEDAKLAYEHARQAYREILGQCDVE
jgi:hypothetical protein